MNIAVEGCLHGELDKVYATLLYIEQQRQIKIDLLICCGDFQSIRNKEDMYAMSCPEKYLSIGNFYEYYTGKKKAPILTIFIGGNHEASNYLRELQFGGWVAENIYYLGSSNMIWVKKGNKKIRIGGFSGIYKDYHFQKGYFEKLPLNDKAKKSIYHVREFDIYKLNFIREDLDVFISHDWPLGIHRYGDVNKLLKMKPYFEQEVYSNTLGNPAAEFILNKLAPKYWFSGHLHAKFTAEVPHEDEPHTTKFLALDKCLPKRDFVQVLKIKREDEEETETHEADQQEPVELFYDAEWLAIQRLLLSKSPVQEYETRFFNQVNREIDWTVEDYNEIIGKVLEQKDIIANKVPDLRIPLNFQKTTEPYDPKQPQNFIIKDKLPLNNQTEAYLKMLEIDATLFNNCLYYDHEKKKIAAQVEVQIKDSNDDEIDLGFDLGNNQPQQPSQPVVQVTVNPNPTEKPSNDINVTISLEDLPFV